MLLISSSSLCAPSSRHTRHRSIPALRGYVREGTVFVNNASARLGL
jgi:hypothetical protein